MIMSGIRIQEDGDGLDAIVYDHGCVAMRGYDDTLTTMDTCTPRPKRYILYGRKRIKTIALKIIILSRLCFPLFPHKLLKNTNKLSDVTSNEIARVSLNRVNIILCIIDKRRTYVDNSSSTSTSERNGS